MTCTRNFLVRTQNLWFYTVCPYKTAGTLVHWYRNSGTTYCRPISKVRLTKCLSLNGVKYIMALMYND